MSQIMKINKDFFSGEQQGLLLDWLKPPQSPADWAVLLSHIPFRIKAQDQNYQFSGCNVTVDIRGSAVWLHRCNYSEFDYNFDNDQSVLLADNPSDAYPIHLSFDPPIRALGTQFSATSGITPVGYQGMLAVRLKGSAEWEPSYPSAQGILGRQRGTAPFLGLAVENNEPLIEEAWFKVVDPNNDKSVNFPHVAITDLYFLP